MKHKARSIEEAVRHADTIIELSLRDQGLEALPDELWTFGRLVSLDLSGNRIPALPEEIARLHGLETLVLKNTGLHTLPEAIGRLPRLRKLILDRNALRTLPESIDALTELVELHLAGNGMTELPETLFRLPRLASLILHDNALRDLPPAVTDLRALQYLDLRNNILKSFPPEIARLPHLEFVLTEGNLFLESIPEATTAEVLQRFFQETHRRQTPPEVRVAQLRILLDAPPEAPDKALYLRALDAPIAEVRALAPDFLYRLLPAPFAEKPRAVCLIGKFSEVRRSQARKDLLAQGVTVENRPSGPETVVVTGERPGTKLEQALELGCTVAVEGHLSDLLHTAKGEYLAVGPSPDNPMTANLLRLLRSYRKENIELALSLIEGAGMPEEALPEVLGIRLFHQEEDVRARAAGCFEQFADRSLAGFAARCAEEAYENELPDLELLLERVAAHRGVDEAPLVRAALTMSGTGLRLAVRMPPAEQAELLPLALNKGVLRLERMELKAFPEGLAEVDRLYWLFLSRNALRSLPPAVGKLKTVSLLELGDNRLEELPEEIGGMAALESLDLCRNRLRTLPEGICRLENLSALRLDGNLLTGLPDCLKHLPKLEMLSLHGCPLAGAPVPVFEMTGLRSLILGDCGLAALPEEVPGLRLLESLGLDRNPLGTIPEWVGTLPRLRFLDLSYVDARTLPQSLAHSRTLERVYLMRDDSMDWEQVLSVLQKIQSLQYLYLRRNKIVLDMQRRIERTLRGVAVRYEN